MRILESFSDLDAERDRFPFGRGAAVEAFGQRFPFKALHDQKIKTVLRIEIVDGRARWGWFRRERAIASRRKSRAGQLVGKRGWGASSADVAPQVLVPGDVDHAHAARAELVLEGVVGERFAEHGA